MRARRLLLVLGLLLLTLHLSRATALADGYWTNHTSMPTARSRVAAVAGPDGHIYAIGGYNSSGDLTTVEAYGFQASQATLTVTGPTSGTYGQSYTLTSSGGSGTGAVTYGVGTSTACTIPTSGTNAGKLAITSGTGWPTSRRRRSRSRRSVRSPLVARCRRVVRPACRPSPRSSALSTTTRDWERPTCSASIRRG